jgi:uncharacterized membrane protein
MVENRFNRLKHKASNVSKWLIFFTVGVAIYIIMSGVLTSLGYLFKIKTNLTEDPFMFSDLDKEIPNFDNFNNTKKAKLVIAEAISISLGFLLAASLIEQTIDPDYYHLGILGILVLLHIVIGYTVNQEINNAVEQNVLFTKQIATMKLKPK